MKIDLNLTKHRAILFIPSMVTIILMCVYWVCLLCGKNVASTIFPIYFVGSAYTLLISFILLIHDTRRDSKLFKEKYKL
jgi:hypothetical protein